MKDDLVFLLKNKAIPFILGATFVAVVSWWIFWMGMTIAAKDMRVPPHSPIPEWQIVKPKL